MSTTLFDTPTDPFLIHEPQNQSIVEQHAGQKRWTTDCGALKLWKVRPGRDTKYDLGVSVGQIRRKGERFVDSLFFIWSGNGGLASLWLCTGCYFVYSNFDFYISDTTFFCNINIFLDRASFSSVSVSELASAWKSVEYRNVDLYHCERIGRVEGDQWNE